MPILIILIYPVVSEISFSRAEEIEVQDKASEESGRKVL